jgi:hypothetical protein
MVVVTLCQIMPGVAVAEGDVDCETEAVADADTEGDEVVEADGVDEAVIDNERETDGDAVIDIERETDGDTDFVAADDCVTDAVTEGESEGDAVDVGDGITPELLIMTLLPCDNADEETATKTPPEGPNATLCQLLEEAAVLKVQVWASGDVMMILMLPLLPCATAT